MSAIWHIFMNFLKGEELNTFSSCGASFECLLVVDCYRIRATVCYPCPALDV